MFYPVNEIFETIQGEATYTGTPAIFVRLQGCPVGCPWCDTKHTWEVEPQHATAYETIRLKTEDAPTYTRLDAAMLVARVQEFDAAHVVITGGEPCLYDLRPLTTALLDAHYTVQIETSGTQEVLCDPRTFVTVSPKLHMPGGLPVLRSALTRANEIKHPLGKAADYHMLAAEVLPHIDLTVTPVWLQPLSQSKKATDLCIHYATEYHHKVSIQTHKFLGVR
jgi:7-carboxy-7-deazaguanine synthase